MKFRELSPLAKLAVWIGMIAAILALLQGGLMAVGSTTNVLSNGTFLLVTTLASLMLLMSWDRRPISDFGFIVGPTWKKLWARGIGAGLLSYGIYVAIAFAAGVYAVNLDRVTPARTVTAFFTGMTAMPLAVTQQIIFSGYLLAMLRDKYGRAASVIVCSGLFAVLNKVDNLPAFADPITWQLLAGLFCVAALLCTLRMLTGSILIPAGLLAGWIFVRRFTGELRLFDVNYDAPLTAWIVPGGDTRQAPLMIGSLLVGLVAAAIVLRRRGEAVAPLSEQAINADFKRVFPLSHAAALAPLDVWLPRLFAARFRIGLDYIPRLIAVLVMSTANTIITLPERFVMAPLVRRRKVRDPLFVVGVHRSGTTHFQNLLALDPQFCTTRAYHMMNPAGSLISGWALLPLLAAFMPWKRPMDAVRFGAFTPEEEEHVLTGTSGLTPYWGMTFPRQWPTYEKYFFTEELAETERHRWETAYYRVLQRITFWSNLRPMLKNPCNTGRVATLRRMFPHAKFVHISRHPHQVVLSNRRLAREGHVVNQLQNAGPEHHYESRYLDYYHDMESACQQAAEQLPDEQFAHLRYEDLVDDPKREIRRVYTQLGIEYTARFDRRIDAYLSEVGTYQKNKHAPLTGAEKARINERMRRFMVDWDYQSEQGKTQRAA